MWWFHLLIRRVDALQKRVQVVERVVLAVGTFRYAECGERLLVELTTYPHSLCEVYRLDSRRSRLVSPAGAPSVMCANGTLQWRRNARESGAPFMVSIDGRVSYESYYLDGSRGDMTFTFHKTPDEVYQLLREGFK